MSPLKISYHHISSVTVSSSNRHKYVQAVYYHDMFCLDIFTLEEGTNWLSQNIRMELPFMLRTIPEDSRPQNIFNFSASLHQKNAKCLNVFCDIISENIVQ